MKGKNKIMELVVKNNKVVKMNDIELTLHEIVGYKNYRRYMNGEMVLVSLPVVKRLSNKDLLSMFFMGLIGCGLFYTFLVLIIGLAPLNR